MNDNDPNEAYEVVPIEPGPRGHGPPKGWWTVKRNGIAVRHFPGKEKAERFATDPEYRASLVSVGEGEGEVRSKGTWYVSFEPKERLPGQRAITRKTETFRAEQDAKTFAKAKLTDGSNINAGTLNPYQPKRIITSVQISDWLNELDD